MGARPRLVDSSFDTAAWAYSHTSSISSSGTLSRWQDGTGTRIFQTPHYSTEGLLRARSTALLGGLRGAVRSRRSFPQRSSCGFVLLPDIILHYSKTICLHIDDDQLRQDFPIVLPAQLMLDRPLVTYPALPFIARKGKANWHQSSRNWYRTCHSERDSARRKPPSTRQEQLTDLRGLPRRPSAISCPSKTFTEIPSMISFVCGSNYSSSSRSPTLAVSHTPSRLPNRHGVFVLPLLCSVHKDETPSHRPSFQAIGGSGRSLRTTSSPTSSRCSFLVPPLARAQHPV